MEIYVDELPKYCNYCYLQQVEYNSGKKNERRVCVYCYDYHHRRADLKFDNEYTYVHKNCPLKLLGDHDKEVRAEERARVVAEIRKFYTTEIYKPSKTNPIPHTRVGVLLDRLDQIERGGEDD